MNDESNICGMGSIHWQTIFASKEESIAQCWQLFGSSMHRQSKIHQLTVSATKHNKQTSTNGSRNHLQSQSLIQTTTYPIYFGGKPNLFCCWFIMNVIHFYLQFLNLRRAPQNKLSKLKNLNCLRDHQNTVTSNTQKLSIIFIGIVGVSKSEMFTGS